MKAFRVPYSPAPTKLSILLALPSAISVPDEKEHELKTLKLRSQVTWALFTQVSATKSVEHSKKHFPVFINCLATAFLHST